MKRTLLISLTLCISLFSSACGASQAEYETLQAENEALSDQVKTVSGLMSISADKTATTDQASELDELQAQAEELAKTSKDITSGSLYDTVTSIFDNVFMSSTADGNLSIMFIFEQGTAEENAANFFNISEQIIHNYAIEEEYSSIVFMVKTDSGLSAMLTLIDYESPDSFMSTLTVLEAEYKTAFMSAYEQSPLNKDIANQFLTP